MHMTGLLAFRASGLLAFRPSELLYLTMHTIKRILFFLLAVALLFACSGKYSGPTAAQLAAQAAQNYYTQLLRGDYEAFVAGRYQPHAIPDNYREQLVANAKMFIGQQKDDHQGVVKAQAVDAQADTTHHVANVFINLIYGDKTTEEVVVPMVERKGVWYMR
jgi:hypothetical protein